MPQPMFRDELAFLSNFHPCSIVDKDGTEWPSSEHAYQAMKFGPPWREFIRKHPMTGLKKACRGIPGGIRPNWDKIRDQVMEAVVRAKFNQSPYLMAKLKATGELELIETNWWHDNYWGSCFCPRCGGKGKNELGKLLMRIRKGD